MTTWTDKAIRRQHAEWRRERRYQRRYAKLHGYFWLPCPLCGEPFGGHESAGAVPTAEPSRSTCICPFCTAQRQQKAEEILREHDLGGFIIGSHSHFPHPIEHKVGADFEVLDG